MNYRILPPDEMLEARPVLPLSKSISNRLIVINALTPGDRPLPPLSDSDDTHLLLQAVKARSGVVDIDGAGTAMRFLAAFYASRPGVEVTLTGNERMRHRPVGPLVDALRTLGADITYGGDEGFPPLVIRGRELAGGELSVDATVSSQFVSALMMVAPLMRHGLRLQLDGEPVSLPYIRMTLAMMQQRGIDCELDDSTVSVTPGEYTYADIPVEADWSGAAVWYEIQALAMGTVTLDGLRPDSLQGDSHVAAIYESLGVNTDFESADGAADLLPSPDQLPRINIDMSPWPDLVPTVAVTCAMLGIPFRLSGLSTLRLKESDRVETIAAELGRLGFVMETGPDFLAWEMGRRPISELPRFATHGDHRIAMAMAPVALFVPGIVVEDVEVVTKSYPAFWDELRKAGFTLLDGDAPLPEPETDAE